MELMSPTNTPLCSSSLSKRSTTMLLPKGENSTEEPVRKKSRTTTVSEPPKATTTTTTPTTTPTTTTTKIPTPGSTTRTTNATDATTSTRNIPLNPIAYIHTILSHGEDDGDDETGKHCLSSFNILKSCRTRERMTQHLGNKSATVDSFDVITLDAIQNNDLQTLKKLLRASFDASSQSSSLDVCNKFRESLVHLASRRAQPSIVKFLIKDAKVALNQDSQGRTPLHNACLMTERPNWELLDVLLQAEPEHILVRDNSGKTPFEYVPKDHWAECIKFLSNRTEWLQHTVSLSKYEES